MGWFGNDGYQSGRVFRYAGLFMGGTTLLGALIGHKHDVRRQRQGPDFKNHDLRALAEGQAEFSGMETPHKSQSGFTETGVNAARKKSLTDFGSPYQGPMTLRLFLSIKICLLNEREMEVYNVNHFDEKALLVSIGKGLD